MTTEVEYVAGLRALADWIEQNPGHGLPVFAINNFELNSKEEAHTIPAKLSPAIHIAAMEEDVLGWECGSLLATDSELDALGGEEQLVAAVVPADDIPL